MDERTSHPAYSAASAPSPSSRSNDTAASAAAPGGSAPRAYRAVFFDLDGTLLPIEIGEFLRAYFKTIARFVAERGMDAQAFSAGLDAGIGAMASHEDGRLNASVFWETFFAHAEGGEDAWFPLLDEFYEREFGALGASVQADPASARIVETLAAKGYPLVLATMPLFPLRAVQWRVSWAGLDAQRFSRLTSFENSTSVKPKLDYFAENLAACGLAGSDVLMVGNNTVEDLAICGLGADAFLVTDHLLDPTERFDVASVRHGSLDELAAWVETLPACANPAVGIERGSVDAAAREAALAAGVASAASAAAPGDKGIAAAADGAEG